MESWTHLADSHPHKWISGFINYSESPFGCDRRRIGQQQDDGAEKGGGVAPRQYVERTHRTPEKAPVFSSSNIT
jgi:hypothetical protein